MALGVEGIEVGMWTDLANGTGCTVVLPPPRSLGVASVRGGAPGTREVPALSPTGSVQECHGVVLCGNSVFGLAAADGVVGWCEANGRGLDLRVATVPVIGAAVVYDLRKAGTVRPTRDAGWAACEAATSEDPPMGSVGVGTGCSVGKIGGRAFSVKGGQGWAVATSGSVVVGAIMAVNALGDIIDDDGSVIAGSSADADAPRFPHISAAELAKLWIDDGNGDTGDIGPDGLSRVNTTIGCLVTNAKLSKPDAYRAVDLAHTGIARAVDPPHTSHDGDALFMLCTREVETHTDLVAHLGARAVADAIRAGVRHAEGTDTVPADPRAKSW